MGTSEANRSGPSPAPPDLEYVRRYGRQLILPEIGLAGQRRLGDSRVLVVGLGGLGASAAVHLAAVGVGELLLIDPDRVELSNLHRQWLYTVSDVGRPKAEAARDRLAERNPSVRVHALTESFERERAVEQVASVDVVLDSTDNFPTRYRVNDAAVRARRPEVFASVFRLEGQLAVFDAATGPCYRCLFPEPPPPDARPGCGDSGVLGVLPPVLGALQAAEAIRVLLGWRPPGPTRLNVFDMRGMEVRAVELRKRVDCTGCGPGAAESAMPPDESTAAVPPSPVGFDFLEPRALAAELRGTDPPSLVDVREEVEHGLGAIAGSIWIPLDRLPDRIAELAATRRPVVYCQWGGRSERAGRLLAEAGLRPVRVLRGGLDAYAAEVDPSLPRF